MTVASPRLLPSTKLKGDMIHRSLRDRLDFKKCVIVAGIPALFAAQPASVFPRGGLQKRRLFDYFRPPHVRWNGGCSFHGHETSLNCAEECT
jgi:hypothetical protein